MCAKRTVSTLTLVNAFHSFIPRRLPNEPQPNYDDVKRLVAEKFNVKININWDKTTFDDDNYITFDVEFLSEAKAELFVLNWSDDKQLSLRFWS